MTLPPDEDAPLAPASPIRRQAGRAALAGISLIWLVPILALVVTLALAWNAYAGRGETVAVAFEDATGITPGETVVKFREITVGKVEAVRFSQDLTRVILDMRIDEDVAQYIDADARFWIVRPQVSAAGVSRLDTVLTGAFVEGDWDSAPAAPRPDVLAGLPKPPLIRRNQAGTWVTLASDNAAGILEGAPVMYRGVAVGRMENLRLAEGGDGVLSDVFIEAPEDKRLTTSTVFWDTSGLSLSLGAQGLALNVDSLASLLQGGVQFETLTSGGAPVEPGHIFRLQPDEDTARNALFDDDPANDLRLTTLVPGDLRGLTKGAEVRYAGVTVGRVTDLKLREEGGTMQQELSLAVSPKRIAGLPEPTAAAALDRLSAEVAQGLRARVISSGFLGTALVVDLAPVAGQPTASLDRQAQPYPLIPPAPPAIENVTASAQDFLGKIGDLPLAETLNSVRNTADSITALAASDDTRAIPRNVRLALDDAKAALAEVRTMVTELREGGALTDATATLAQTKALTARLNAAAEKLPALVERIDAVAASAQQVDLAALGARATEAAAGLRDVVASDAAKALPAQVGGAVASLKATADDIKALTGDLRTSGAAARVGPLLDNANAAVDAVRTAAGDVPEMVDRINAAADKISATDFPGIGTEAKGLVADLRAMLGTEDAAQLPKNLSDTLKAASGLLNDLRDGNAAGSLNAMLASAKTAADEIAGVTRRLPQVLARFEQTAARAEATIAAYGERSAFNTEALGMMRELRRATSAFGSLAATIERNPRAFILGR